MQKHALKVNLLMIKILLLFFLPIWIIKTTAVSPAALLNFAKKVFFSCKFNIECKNSHICKRVKPHPNYAKV